MRESRPNLLEAAIRELKTAELNGAEIDRSATRLTKQLGLQGVEAFTNETKTTSIEDCHDVQRLRTSYRRKLLPASQALLIEAHLRDCGECLRHLRSADNAALNWSVPGLAGAKTSRGFSWSMRRLGWVLVPALGLMLLSIFLYRAYWQVPPGVRAEVRSIDGAAYSISDGSTRRLSAGDTLGEGEHVRTTGGAHALLALTDGSTIEINERSLIGINQRGKNTTLSLDNGAVIVQSVDRPSGHFYVKSPDCRATVAGTILSVSFGIKGSQVAVLKGAALVSHAGIDTVIRAGNQLATYDNTNPAPAQQQIAQQISWSRDRDKYLMLMAQFATLEQRVGAIPFPQPRYTSDLLARVPADSLLYISIPNLGDFLSEANSILHDQLNQSPVLHQWWAGGEKGDTAQVDAMVERLHEVSQYLGDEVVIVGVAQRNSANRTSPGVAFVADVRKDGLADFLRSRFAASGSDPGLTVLDDQALKSMSSSLQAQSRGYALVGSHEAVFSDSIATLKEVSGQLSAGDSGFATGDFGQQIKAAYGRGAGVIVAADLHKMLDDGAAKRTSVTAIEISGMDGVKYLIAEHRESNGTPENHLNLQFSGTRQRVASWLAAPGSLASLDFVTPNAAFAAAALTKDPKAIADDLISMAEASGKDGASDLDTAAARLHVNFRDDLAASLGGEFLVALDGPVLPTPSWKAVVEVLDAATLEQTLEQLAQASRDSSNGAGVHGATIDSNDVNGQRFYAVYELTSGSVVANYTFADGYLILGSTRALLFDALRAHTSGDSLGRSAAFKGLLPQDENENYSAVAYQNLSPVLIPLLSQVSGETAAALRQLAADSRPTAICAWGKDSRIEAASDSRLFGFDFLTLASFIHPHNDSRNKLSSTSVSDQHGRD